MSLLTLQNISLVFDENWVFSQLNLALLERETVCISTGVLDGGSSLLKVASGLYTPTGGSVLVNNRPLVEFSEQERFQSTCLCFEEGGLLSIFTNYNNIAFPMLYHTHLDSDEIAARITDLAEKLGIVDLLPLEPHQLNDVQTRLMNLLRGLVFRPKVLLLDEVQSGMSLTMRENMLRVLFNEQEAHGFGILMTVTAGDETQFASRILGITNGRLELIA